MLLLLQLAFYNYSQSKLTQHSCEGFEWHCPSQAHMFEIGSQLLEQSGKTVEPLRGGIH